MRCIGSLPDSALARRFGDYLVAEGVANQVEENASGLWDVWVLNDDQLDEARRELERFSSDPAATRYDGVDAEARRIRAAEQARAERLRRNYTDVRTQWARRAGLPAVTLVVIVATVIVAAGTQLGMRDTPLLRWLLFAPYTTSVEMPEESGQSLLTGSNIGYGGERMFGAILSGQVWRLLTPALIHFGPLHLLFNLLWLFRFGQMIEWRKGSVFFALLVLAGALVGNLAQAGWIVLDVFNQGVFYGAFGGLSGVVYALFGYSWLMGRRRPHEQIGTDPTTNMIMFGWLVFCMLGLIGNVGNAAHVAGLLTGMAVALLNPRLPRKLRAGS